MVQLSQTTEQANSLELSLIKNFKWWVVVVIVLVLAIMGWLLVWPKFIEWRSMTQARDLQARLYERQEKFSLLKKQVNQWRSIKSQLGDDLQLILPPVQDIPELLVQLETLAARSKLSLQSLSVSSAGTGAGKKVEAGGGVRQIRLLVNLQGGEYKDLKLLLGEIQSAWRLLQVESINYTSQGASLELTGYYYPR